METAGSLINSSLQEILVQASEAPIEPAEMQVAIKYLNRMMAAYSVAGINIGYTVVTDPSDEITVPDPAIEGMVFNLALRLCSQYDTQASQELLLNAREGKTAMYKVAVQVVPTAYPERLPRGSGNTTPGFTNDNFYSGDVDGVLTEQAGFIATEPDTQPSE